MVYPMRIKHHICVVDEPRNIRYIKWTYSQEVLTILRIYLAEENHICVPSVDSTDRTQVTSKLEGPRPLLNI